MRPCIAINNSPYYYYNVRMAKSIGIGIPRTGSVVGRLARVISRCAMDCDDGFVPGIQFGVESDRALQGRALQRGLCTLAEDEGLAYVVHIPDLVVPGTYRPSGLLSRIASLGYARSSPSHSWFERFMEGRIASAKAIGATAMVIHLPNGPDDEHEVVESYLVPSLSDALREAGITMCIENCNNAGNPFFAEVGPIVELVRRLGVPYGFCFDYGHYMVGRDAADRDALLLAARHALMHHVHINDTSGDSHLFLGERPKGANADILDAVESQYREVVLGPSAGIATTYVLERNKPYSYDLLLQSVTSLLSVISGTR